MMKYRVEKLLSLFQNRLWRYIKWEIFC